MSGIAMGASAMAPPAAMADAAPKSAGQGRQPNIVMICADQMRPDFIGAYRENSTTKTPNLDGVAERGTVFKYAVTNQPLCSPSRACMITGRYASETGEWKLAQELNKSLPTLASVLRSHGYTANFIGKWHLMKNNPETGGSIGPVPREDRGGFLDLWEGANEFEHTTHPYKGTIWDAEGKEITFENEYRVDFITQRAVRFLEQPQEKPFLLYVSQLEPHFQNDEKRFVAPKGYAERFQNPFVPEDLIHFPGDWQAQLPDYYGCIQSIDESVGTILKTLEKRGLLENTIVVFISDHGCSFKTRNTEYKRSPHDSAIRIPFLFQGPGFDNSTMRNEIVSMIDLTPTLLSAAGVPVPESMKGKNLLPLLNSPAARKEWENVAYIQISESMVARAVRTAEWCYCVADPTKSGTRDPGSTEYQEYQMYNVFDDPAELINLAGRQEFRAQAAMLRELLQKRMAEAGEPPAQISPAKLYP